MATSKVSIKLLVDRNKQKVLFAEASKDVIDFLFNLLCLPMGTVVGLLQNKDMVGCLPNLYKSIESLNEAYMQPNASKDVVLKPEAVIAVSEFRLSLTDDMSTAKKVYMCGNSYSGNKHPYVSYDPRAICPKCMEFMSYEVQPVDPPGVKRQASSGGGGGYVKGLITYMVMDDLVVNPMSTISSITLLNKFNIRDVGVLEEIDVTFGMEEALKLLKASLQSKSVLTDTFLENQPTFHDWARFNVLLDGEMATRGTEAAMAMAKGKSVFVKVDQLKPGTSGHVLMVKVVSSNTVLQKSRSASQNMRQTRIVECLVGDETGTVIFAARNKQVDYMKPGTTVILCNAKINMFGGSMRLAVDKWGRVEVTDPADFVVKEDNNISLVEYELVNVLEE